MLSAATTVFNSGNDSPAKDVLTDLGWAAAIRLKLGEIATAKAVEHYFVLFTRLRLNFGEAAFNIALVR